jgi:hypothetical protein
VFNPLNGKSVRAHAGGVAVFKKYGHDYMVNLSNHTGGRHPMGFQKGGIPESTGGLASDLQELKKELIKARETYLSNALS